MSRPRHEVAGILKAHLPGFLSSHRLASHHLRTLKALQQCRTAALGGHIDQCDSCGHRRISYNSCRNRHCPKCQAANREKWILKRQEDLLPVPYFHVVFTLPHELNGLCMAGPGVLYNLLFKCAWGTLKTLAADPKYLGGRTGMIALLHTWGQNLSLHPHLHCIVPGGGLSQQHKWRSTRSKGKFLFPVKAMSKLFRGKFLAGLKELYRREELIFKGQSVLLEKKKAFQHLLDQLYAKKWVVYAKRPFGGPKQVIEYLGRYSHKVAISNHRLLNVSDGKVTFSAKDYRQGGKKKSLTLKAEEFIRRFCLHILPLRFCKIRHYGILANRPKAQALKACRKSIGVTKPQVSGPEDGKEALLIGLGFEAGKCPECTKGRMLTIEGIPNQRAPPQNLPAPDALGRQVLAKI